MATIKLNAEMRDNLYNEIVGDTYKKLREAHKQRKFDFDAKLIQAFLPEELKLKIASLPADWFENCHGMSFSFAGQYHYIDFGKTSGSRTYEKLPHYLTNQVRLDATHKLTEEFEAINNELKDIQSQETREKNRIMSILRSCSSAKQLIEVWPELETIVNKVCLGAPKAKSGLPAIMVDDINTKYNLPKEEK